MDITFLNMNMLYIKYMDGAVRRQCHLPLGPLYLLSAMGEAGIEVDYRDYQLQDAPELFEPEALCDYLKDPAPIIGISAMANLVPFILFALPMIKKRYPHSTIILGGVSCIDIEREVMERFPQVDIIHRGEGEASVPVLVKALKENRSLKDVPNIFYRDDNTIVQTKRAARIKDLDNLSRPSYDGLDFKKYVGHNILGSRGCPFLCTFCSIAPVWDLKAYSRSNENIVSEMVAMHTRFGVKQFLFQDEFFVSSPERIIDFSKKLISSGIDITYKVFARVDLVNIESLKALADSGCVEIRFGIESGSDKVLGETKKGFDSEKALTVVSEAKKIIDSVDVFYVWGFPFETMDDFSESIFQMITFRGMGVNILPSLLTYLPQTEIYKGIEDKSKLEFCPYLLPEYMITGIEKRVSVRIAIDEGYSDFFDFIMTHKDIFPGYFHLDVENNIIPKLEMLEEFDFYKTDVDESCGAHSPSEGKIDLTLNV